MENTFPNLLKWIKIRFNYFSSSALIRVLLTNNYLMLSHIGNRNNKNNKRLKTVSAFQGLVFFEMMVLWIHIFSNTLYREPWPVGLEFPRSIHIFCHSNRILQNPNNVSDICLYFSDRFISAFKIRLGRWNSFIRWTWLNHLSLQFLAVSSIQSTFKSSRILTFLLFSDDMF